MSSPIFKNIRYVFARGSDAFRLGNESRNKERSMASLAISLRSRGFVTRKRVSRLSWSILKSRNNDGAKEGYETQGFPCNLVTKPGLRNEKKLPHSDGFVKNMNAFTY